MADPASSPLGRMLLDEITPVVMVLRTPLVEESCQKNGLTLVEMLSPYCVFENIDVPVRTASDQPYRLQKFKLRLFYASDVRRSNIEVAKERLEQVISHAAEKDSSALCSEPPQIETLLSTSQTELLPTWFQFFNRELVRTVSFSEHESFDHPVACLLVVSSKDEDPINKFVDLFNTNQLPSLLNDGAMDPKILKHFLLVHDNQDGTTEKATKILTQMRSTFGSNDCRLLCINSSQDELTENQDNQWTPYQKSDVSPTQRIGHFLNLDDLDELKDTMQNLSSKHIIPHMEQKIRDLNQQVSATRKGFRNQIKNLWWRKGKEDTPENPHGPTYTFSSIESQIRVLSDYAFMLRDYELALSNYRLLSTDYKLDKAWKNYAGVQEMMGLTYFMLDQSRKEAEYCMENAFNTYLRIGSSGLQNAIRCGLWWVEMLKARDQYKEAAGVYFRITGEEPLHSAVMLEQASYCYLFTKPPMLRKYGFHLVLSGDLYEKCDQIKHAIRTYRVALTVFKGATWSHIKDHVHFHVGKWFAFIGMFDVAVNHMLEVLACSQQSKSTQEQFLRDFFQIVQRAGKTFEVMRLQLPVIDIPSLKVVFEDHRTYASTEAGGVRESLWRSLEDDMLPSSSIIRTNWLDSQPKLLLKKFKESNICISGEAIKVDIGFRNPLQVPVSVSSVSLVCEHFVGTDDMLPDTDGSTNVNENDEEFKKLVSDWELSSESSPFALSEVDILLEGGETVSAHLTVTPRVEGVLKIVGVRWKLSGLVIGFCNFETNLMKRKVVKGRRKRKQSTSQNLKFLVIKSQPKLEGFIRDLPRTVYAGDLRRLTLKLRNPSEHPVKNLKMKISHPRFLNIGNREVLNMDFPSCLEKNENSSEGDSLPDTSKASTTVFLFPEDTLIHGETPFFWPLWLRGAAPGNISLYIAIYYEIGDVSSVMKYRILRMHYNLEVLPSLDVSFHISSCLSRLQEFLVRMDVVNRAGLESFQLHQLSSIGNHWEISLFQPINSIFPMEFLVAGQAFSCFFKLKNCRKSVTTEDDGSSGHDVRLHNDSKALFDIYSKPLVDFHHQERMHQETRNEGNQNMVDFILISRMQSDLTSSPKILSHHACHCSVKTASPIWWVMDGPRTLNHDFASSFCEVKLSMTIYNASDFASTIRICALDPTPSPTDETGWHDLSLPNDIKISSDVPEKRVAKSPPQEFAPPFIWSGSSSTRIKLDPMSKTDIPLDICVFSPGTFDLSNYILDWNLTGSDDGAGSSGTCRGHPYYLTVLPQD